MPAPAANGRLVPWLAAAAVALAGRPAAAAPTATPPSVALPASTGQPTVKLVHLELPEMPRRAVYERHLRQTLRREARRADWGAGSGSTIEYRYRVTHLALHRQGDVLRVDCTAVGELPRGKTAKSQLAFSGGAKEQDRLIKTVLEIVARGVITRLAELERRRRGVDSPR